MISAIHADAINGLEVSLFGRLANLDPRPITSHALVGLLNKRLAMRVNQVNALHLAERLGIEVHETQSEARDQTAIIELHASGAAGTISVTGTLLGERQPRLVRINNYEVEAVLDGHMLFIRHEDCPSVVGALGGILGQKDIKISWMQFGYPRERAEAIALIGISAPLSERTLAEIEALAPIRRVVQMACHNAIPSST
jgi:D-3-phosphoglycerate dehydrogenase